MREITYAQALAEATAEEMRRDPTIIVMGEDVGPYGGNFRATAGLWDEFGEDRVRDTPISEVAIVGTALGAALTGLRPIAEIQFGDFTAVAMDQIVNQVAKARYMSGGMLKAPLVIRTNMGGGRSSAAQHSQSLQAWFCHVPGLKVVLPATPYDAKGLLKTAIRDDDPVIFFEHKMMYNQKGDVPQEEYTIPFGKAEIKHEGKDVTIVATSSMVIKSMNAIETLEKDGISVEIIDPKSLVPLDIETIIRSVQKTNRVVVVDEGVVRCGFGAEVASQIQEFAFDYLDAPIRRVGTYTSPIPFSPTMEKFVVPDEKKIIDAVRKAVDDARIF